MGVGFLAVGFVGTCLSWILLLKYGRRRIYNTGLATLAVLQFIIGILDCAPGYVDRPGIIWAQSTLMVRYPPHSDYLFLEMLRCASFRMS
jgi:MFS transporter, SP family, general alpha glucoside:H+ symporter